MNGTMPATVNSSDGSGEISEALGTTVCPRWAKCSRNRRRISAVCIRGYSGLLCVVTPASGAVRSVLGSVGAAAERLDGTARGKRRVEAGAGPQLALPLGHRLAHVGPELADRLGEVAQRIGERCGDTARGHLLRGARQLAHHEGTDRDALDRPEQPAHQAARREDRRARRAALSRWAAWAMTWPSRFFLAAPVSA